MTLPTKSAPEASKSVPASRRIMAAMMMGLALAIVGSEPAFAQAAGIQTALESIISMITGGIGRALAVIAIMVLGVCWMFNIIRLQTAGFIVLGIAIVFSAAEIASMLGAG